MIALLVQGALWIWFFSQVSQPRGKSNPLDKAVLCSWGRAFPRNPNITFVFKSNIEHEHNRPLIFGGDGW